MKTIGKEKITVYNHTLYAYTVMLKQFSARYSDRTLVTASEDIEKLYKGLSSVEEIADENVTDILNSLHILRIYTLNLQITICNKKYVDINPICEALATFISSIETDIEVATGLN